MYEAPEANVGSAPDEMRLHRSNIKWRDLIVGGFITQLAMTFNKFLYVFFACFFAYGEWSSLMETYGVMEIAFFVYLFFFYLLLIFIFVFVFSGTIAIVGSMSKKGVLGEHTFEFLDEDFVEKTDYNESKHKYNSITKVIVRMGTMYIGMPGMLWHILPGRDFASTDERNELLVFLRGRL